MAYLGAVLALQVRDRQLIDHRCLPRMRGTTVSHFRVFYRRLRGEAWPVVVPMYRLRQCPECFALVLGWEGQEGHEAWHDGGGDDEETAPEVDGYVIGAGELPAELRAGDD